MAMKDSDLVKLQHADFWDNRYALERAEAKEKEGKEELGNFEWFGSFEGLRSFFDQYLPRPESNPSVLHLGCGNSSLTADLYGIGYSNQTSVDFSQVVIDAMSSKYASLSQTWRVEDVRALSFPDSSFDIAIDKGTLDAMIHGSLWDPPDDVIENIGKYVDEVARVLTSGGQWLYITFRQPHFIRRHLEREGVWETKMEILGGGGGTFEYFGWVMKRL